MRTRQYKELTHTVRIPIIVEGYKNSHGFINRNDANFGEEKDVSDFSSLINLRLGNIFYLNFYIPYHFRETVIDTETETEERKLKSCLKNSTNKVTEMSVHDSAGGNIKTKSRGTQTRRVGCKLM